MTGDLSTQLQQILGRYGLHAVLTGISELCDDPPLTWVEQVLDIVGEPGARRVMRTLDRQVSQAISRAAHSAGSHTVLVDLVDQIDKAGQNHRVDHARAWRAVAQSDQLAAARRITNKEHHR